MKYWIKEFIGKKLNYYYYKIQYIVNICKKYNYEVSGKKEPVYDNAIYSIKPRIKEIKNGENSFIAVLDINVPLEFENIKAGLQHNDRIFILDNDMIFDAINSEYLFFIGNHKNNNTHFIYEIYVDKANFEYTDTEKDCIKEIKEYILNPQKEYGDWIDFTNEIPLTERKTIENLIDKNINNLSTYLCYSFLRNLEDPIYAYHLCKVAYEKLGKERTPDYIYNIIMSPNYYLNPIIYQKHDRNYA